MMFKRRVLSFTFSTVNSLCVCIMCIYYAHVLYTSLIFVSIQLDKFTKLPPYTLIFWKTQASSIKGDKAALADDQVIQHLDIEQFTGADYGLGDSNIIRAGGWIPARVIMDNDDRRRIFTNSRSE